MLHIITDTGLFIGIVTRQLIRKLVDEGDVSPGKVKQFYKVARECYTTAITYALEWLPLKDAVPKMLSSSISRTEFLRASLK